jgi:hypothetical protein
MGTDHRGRPLGNNHRPTPRVAQLVAMHLSNVIDSNNEQIQMNNPLLNNIDGGRAPLLSAEEGQRIIDGYRNDRDRGMTSPDSGEQYDLSTIVSAGKRPSYGDYDGTHSLT